LRRHIRSLPGLERREIGIDHLLEESTLRTRLAGRRVALLAQPASTTDDFVHWLDALAAHPGLKLSAAFGPQHGLRGDKQDNVVESGDFVDPRVGLPCSACTARCGGRRR
jgi:uncharacterized protein YbbC (DUF1343 family)